MMVAHHVTPGDKDRATVLNAQCDGTTYRLYWTGRPWVTVVTGVSRYRLPPGRTFHSPIDLERHYRRHGAILRDLACKMGVWN